MQKGLGFAMMRLSSAGSGYYIYTGLQRGDVWWLFVGQSIVSMSVVRQDSQPKVMSITNAVTMRGMIFAVWRMTTETVIWSTARRHLLLPLVSACLAATRIPRVQPYCPNVDYNNFAAFVTTHLPLLGHWTLDRSDFRECVALFRCTPPLQRSLRHSYSRLLVT